MIRENKMTKNLYSYPLNAKSKFEMTYDKSKAHVGRLRYGVDFIVPQGTLIFAALDGIVVDVKQDSDIGGDTEDHDTNGNYIEIRHDSMEYSIYEHIRKKGSLVKVGDEVKRGQIIGYSGATGWLSGLGPHIHFDVHIYHEPKGPEDYETVEITWKDSKK